MFFSYATRPTYTSSGRSTGDGVPATERVAVAAGELAQVDARRQHPQRPVDTVCLSTSSIAGDGTMTSVHGTALPAADHARRGPRSPAGRNGR